MAETLECYIVLQLIVSILSLLSVLLQLIVIIVPSWDRVAKITVLTFSIISTILSLISFGLSDHYSFQHITVLCSILSTGILQTIFLGIAILKKVTFVYSVHAHIVWNDLSTFSLNIFELLSNFCIWILNISFHMISSVKYFMFLIMGTLSWIK